MRHTPKRIYELAPKMLAGLAMGVIAVNLLLDPFLSSDQERRLQQAVLLQPFHAAAHEALGAYYREGNIAAAQREYILASSLPDGQSSDSAAVYSPAQAWNIYRQKQKQLADERQIWERVSATVPDYQYATVKLAQLAYQAGDLPGARKYFLIARSQAPWDPAVASLAAALK